MNINENNIFSIKPLSYIHILIACFSILFILISGGIVRFVNKEKRDLAIENNIGKIIYVIGLLISFCYLINPSIWYQHVFMLKDRKFAGDFINILFFWINLLNIVIVPFSFISKKKSLSYYSVIGFVSILVQIIYPSMNIFYKGVTYYSINTISLIGYVIFIVYFCALTSYQFFDFLKEKNKFNFDKEMIVMIILIIPIIFPYIIFSRFDFLVPRLNNGTVDLKANIQTITVTEFSFSHLLFVFGNALIFAIYSFALSHFIKKENLNDMLIMLTTGLLTTVVCRRSTFMFSDNAGFYLLPDSPCATAIFVAFFALHFKNKTLINYSIFISLAFTSLNNILLFQGDINNLLNYLTLDSYFYHLYTSIILFNIVRLDYFETGKKEILKSCFIFSGIYFFYVILGNVQTRIEFLTGADLCDIRYVGFFYDSPAFPFLDNIINFLAYRENGFDILPINWLITIAVVFAGSFTLYLVYSKVKTIKIKTDNC